MAQLLPCPVCGASLQHLAARPHLDWHSSTDTLNGWTYTDALGRLLFHFDAPAAAADDAPTSKLPPVRETVLRRPPVPEVRELRGPELLRALADELARDDADDAGDES